MPKASSSDDGTTPNRSSAPNGLFRVSTDGAISTVTRDVTGGAAEAIRRLINLAYHASCSEEEGRFPRFRILAGTSGNGRYGVQFGPFPRYVNDTKDLRKLAPAAAFRGSAILFDEPRFPPVFIFSVKYVQAVRTWTKASFRRFLQRLIT
jgi:hypothetical protein